MDILTNMDFEWKRRDFFIEDDVVVFDLRSGEAYKPFDCFEYEDSKTKNRIPPAYKSFIQIRSEKDLLKFYKDFGPVNFITEGTYDDYGGKE